MEDKQPVVYLGSKTNLAMDRPRVPPPRPSTECPDLVRYPDKAPATLRVVNGPRGMSDGSVPNPAATHVIQTRQPVAPDVGAAIAHPQGVPLTTRPPLPTE
jgi:hypothetical protein